MPTLLQDSLGPPTGCRPCHVSLCQPMTAATSSVASCCADRVRACKGQKPIKAYQNTDISRNNFDTLAAAPVRQHSPFKARPITLRIISNWSPARSEDLQVVTLVNTQRE
ncbi:hypothetical protein CONPUDRAFT_142921 [Coniophora puteana RWD-64-598 SS2]|uniref:Uncharacterized protein n=1 Tax=Coniophora puteana (strain RWD-64-598) TaxID=741705 RepID=A0A5M3MUE2_CONPW|nr:uncharacterized protein CONPUDRAFT_142921 [Coniophora puteana RWD-64-598 SS2]EIW82749.1 hypothetical protein CONPUDRAFT_142921 [Coniophora puteana RWD-64-598 SS2]